MSAGRLERLAWAVLLLAAALGTLSEARADDAAEARFFDELGRRAYARGRFEEALSSFLDAHAAAPSPRTLYNVALAAQLAHHEALAFSSFETYLAQPGDDDAHRREDAAHRRDALAGGLALVQVTSEPPGAEIWVDRRELGSFGQTPRTLVLEPGPHTIVLTRASHEDAQLEVIAAVARRADHHAALSPHVGTVHVDVTPPGAVLRLTRRGEERTITAAEDVRVPVGGWSLRAELDGYVERAIELTVSRDAVERRSLALTRILAPTGRLLVSTAEVRARLSIDGVVRTETPARLDGIEVGTHHVTLDAEGFVRWEGDLEVRADHATQLAVTLVPER